MTFDEDDIKGFEKQHEKAQPLFNICRKFISGVRHTDASTLAGLRDMLDVELMVSHVKAAERSLLRAAIDLCEEEIERRDSIDAGHPGAHGEAKLRLAAKRVYHLFS